MDRLTTGDKLVAGGGIVLFLLSFFGPWAKIDIPGAELLPGTDTSLNAWDGYGFFPLELGLILGLVAAGWVIAKAAGTTLPEVPPITTVAVSGLVLLLVLLAVVFGPLDVAFADVVDRGFMLFLAIIPAAAMAWGGYMQMQEETGAARSATYGGTPSPPPPPPTA